MKLLFYCHSLRMGGIERTVSGLANLLCEEHEVVVTQYAADAPFYKLDRRVQYCPLGLEASGNAALRTLGLLLRVRKLLKKHRPDAVFCLNLTHLPLFCLASRGLKTVVIGAERSNPFVHMSKKERLLRRFSVLADGFLFQTARAQQAYPDRTVKKSAVVANAIWNEDVSAPGEIPPEKARRVISVGRLERVKGYDLLIEAFSRVAPEFPDWELVIYGEGKQRAELEELIARHGLGARIRLPGADLHAYRKVRISEVFVLSSRSEGMPNTLLEAMACGVCCISTDCPNGPRELVTPEVDGLLVESENVGALEEALRRVMGDEKMRARLARAAGGKLAEHSPQKYADFWVDFADRLRKKKGY